MNHQKHIEDKKISREILDLPDNIELIALISLGYKDEEEQIQEKELKPFEQVVHFDKY